MNATRRADCKTTQKPFLLSAFCFLLFVAVVGEARTLDVTLFDGTSHDATVLYVDDALDIALLRLAQPPPLQAVAALGDSNELRKGATLYVIGNPVGLELAVATGIVSGRHAAEHVLGARSSDLQAELIQTDAAMNRGVSGGPMFNSRGEVVAIAQTILSKSGGSEGLGSRPFRFRASSLPHSTSERTQDFSCSSSRLTIQLVHREGFDQAIDECELRCLDEMKQQLKELGARHEQW